LVYGVDPPEAFAVRAIDWPLSMMGLLGVGAPAVRVTPTITSTEFEGEVYPDTPLSETTAQ